MNIFNQIRQEIIDIIKSSEDIIANEDILANITLEVPKDKTHGDMSSNAAMVLAKANQMAPSKLATILVDKLHSIKYVEKIEIAGAGFINLTFNSQIWYGIIKDVLGSGKDYGNSQIGNNQKINLEYVSVNPTGPMHIGHARAAVFGDVLAMMLLKCGYDVTKEYYINDAGNQINVLASSAYLRYKQALGENINIEDISYPGDYLEAVGEALKEKYGNELLDKDQKDALLIIKPFVVEAMMLIIREDLSLMGIFHDVFTSENKLHQEHKIQKALEILVAKNLVYKGILEVPKGKLTEDWEEREQLLFKSSEFGDDVDRSLQKSNGEWTYFGAELAYVYDKLQRGFKSMIMILGADHSGYLKRTNALVKALSDDKAVIDIKLCQLVKFVKDSEPLKMSKRAGTYITVRDVLEIVGKDAIRFMMLVRKNDMVIDFDIDKVREQSKDNPVFYVQYAYARCQSILRLSPIKLDANNYDYSLLEKISSEEELSLIKLLAMWPKMVEVSAIHHEPHRIVFYLQDLAASFHSLWNMGKNQKELRFITEDDELSKARLMLVQSVSIVIASALFVLNIEPVDEM